MFDRRGFLQTSCVLASIPGISQATSAGPISTTNTSPMTAVQNEYEQFFAASPDLELLGLPRD